MSCDILGLDGGNDTDDDPNNNQTQDLTAPANLQASAGNGSVDLTWDTVSGATSYHLYMAEVSGVTASNYDELAGGMAHTNISDTSYTHTNLTNGTTYYFVVVAGNDDSNSSESDEVSATPTASTNATSEELTLALDLSSSEYSSLMVTEELAEVEEQQTQGILQQDVGGKLNFTSLNIQAQSTDSGNGANFFALNDDDNVHSIFTNSGVYVLYVASDPTGEYAYVALDVDQSAEFVKLSQCALYRIELADNKVFCVEQNYAPADLDSSFTAALEYQGLKPVQFVTSDDSTSETTTLSGVFYLGRPFTVSGDNISWDSSSNPLIRKLDIASNGSVNSSTSISSDVDTIKSFALLADGLLVYHFSNDTSAGLKLYDNGSTNTITDSSDSADSDYFYSAGDTSNVLMYGKVGDDERIMRFMRSAAGGAVNKKELPSEMINGESTVRVISADDGFVYALTYDEAAEELNFYQLMPFDATPMFSIDVSSSNLAQALDNKVQLYINHAYYVSSASHPQGSYSDRDVINIVKKYNGETRTLLNDDAWSQRYDIYKWKKVKDEIHFAGFDNSTSKMIYGRVDLTAVENNAADSEILSISEISSVLGVSSEILDLEEIRPDAPNKYEAGDPKLEFHADERNPYAVTIEFTKYMNKDDVASGTVISSSSSATTDHFDVWYYKTLHIIYDQDDSNSVTDYLSDDTQVIISIDGETRDYSGFYLSNGMDAEDLTVTYFINLDANQQPTAIITGTDFDLNGYVARPGEVLGIDASSSYDSDGDAISYLWASSPDNYAYIDDYQAATTSLTIDAGVANTSLLLQLTVCDSSNACSTDDLTLEISGVVPSTPSGLSVSAASSSSVNASWSSISDATHYQLYRNTANSSSSASKVYSGSYTSVTDVGLNSGTQYYYWVEACNSNGCSLLSSSANTTTDEEIPATPSNLSASASDSSSVDISWSSVTGATYYDLYRNISGDSPSASRVYSANATSTTDTGLEAETQYYYWIRACNGAGCSDLSPSVTATTGEEVPDVPSELSVSANDSSSADISWLGVTAATYYELYRNTANNSSSAAQVYVGGNTSITDTELESSTEYYYWVKACNSGGCSDFSVFASATTDEGAPSSPVDLSASASSSSAISISWSSVASATYYELYRNTSSNSSSAALIHTNSSTSYTDSGLDSGTLYYYWLKACNSVGCSDLSESANATTNEVVPSAPSSLSASANGSSSISVNWSSVTGASYYELYRNTANNSTSASLVDTYSSTSITNSGLDSGTQYYYWIRACNSAGCSGFSASANATTDQEAPTTPSAPSASASGSSSISISWSSVSGATYYELYRNTSNSSSSSLLVYADSGTSTTDTGLDSDAQYYYWLKACNDAGCSGFSSSANATTNVAIPNTPSSISASVNGSSSITISWSSVTGATDYQLYRNTSSSSSSASLVSTYSSTSATDSGLASGTKYYYWVKACNSAGCSSFSSYANATTDSVFAGNYLLQADIYLYDIADNLTGEHTNEIYLLVYDGNSYSSSSYQCQTVYDSTSVGSTSYPAELNCKNLLYGETYTVEAWETDYTNAYPHSSDILLDWDEFTFASSGTKTLYGENTSNLLVRFELTAEDL